MKVSPYILPGLKYSVILSRPHEETIGKIADYYNVELKQLKGKDRKRELVVARQVCICAMYYLYQWTLDRAGKLFNRDHTTAIHSLNTVKNLTATSEQFKEDLRTACPDLVFFIENRQLPRNKRFYHKTGIHS